MRKLLFALLSILLVICSAACAQQAEVMEPLSMEEMESMSAQDKRKDLEYLCAELEKRHKDMYHSISKETFLAEKERIAANIESLSYAGFFYELKGLVASIGDAHTRILLAPSEYDYLRSLPVALRMIDGSWYLLGTEKAHEKYLGWQITAINGLSLQEVFDRAAQLNSHENQVVLQNGCAADICFAEALQYLGVTDDITEVHFTLLDPASGAEETAAFVSYQGRALYNAETAAWQTEQPPTARADAYYLSRKIEQGVYFIQYNACAEDASYPMKDFAKDIRDDLTGEPYQKVIVDLRYNGGGNSAILEPVIELLQEQQEQQGFLVYTLIGSETYSSAVLNAVELKNALDCVLAGTPTAGNLNHFGEVRAFDLKTFPVRVTYSTKYFEYMPDYEGDSIYPDMPVVTRYEDVVNGIDREVQAVLAE